MKKIFIFCSEPPGLCDDIKYLLDIKRKEGRNLEIVFKESGNILEKIPDEYDGYHLNITAFSLKDIEDLRSKNPQSLIYGTGLAIDEENKKKADLLNYYNQRDVWKGIKELLDRLSTNKEIVKGRGSNLL